MLGETDLSSSLRRGLTHAFHARGFNEHSRRVHKPQPLNLDSEALNKPEARYWFRDCSHLLEGSDTGNLGEVQRPRIRFFGCLVESAVPYFLTSFEFSPSVLVMVHRVRFCTLCSLCNLLVVVFFFFYVVVLVLVAVDIFDVRRLPPFLLHGGVEDWVLVLVAPVVVAAIVSAIVVISADRQCVVVLCISLVFLILHFYCLTE